MRSAPFLALLAALAALVAPTIGCFDSSATLQTQYNYYKTFLTFHVLNAGSQCTDPDVIAACQDNGSDGVLIQTSCSLSCNLCNTGGPPPPSPPGPPGPPPPGSYTCADDSSSLQSAIAGMTTASIDTEGITAQMSCTDSAVLAQCANKYSTSLSSLINSLCAVSCDNCNSNGGDDGDCYDDDAQAEAAAALNGVTTVHNCVDVRNQGYCTNPASQKLAEEVCPFSCGLCVGPTWSPTTTTTEAPLTLPPCTADAPAFLVSLVTSIVGDRHISSCTDLDATFQCADDTVIGATLRDLCCHTCGSAQLPAEAGEGDLYFARSAADCHDTHDNITLDMFAETCAAAAAAGKCENDGWTPLFCRESCGKCPGRCGDDASRLTNLVKWGYEHPTCGYSNLERCADPLVGYLYQMACCDLCRGTKMPSVFGAISECEDTASQLHIYHPEFDTCAQALANCTSNARVAMYCPKTCQRCGLTRTPAPSRTGMTVTSSSKGLSQAAKLGIGLGVGLFALVALLALLAVVVLAAAAKNNQQQNKTQSVLPYSQPVINNPAYYNEANTAPAYDEPVADNGKGYLHVEHTAAYEEAAPKDNMNYDGATVTTSSTDAAPAAPQYELSSEATGADQQPDYQLADGGAEGAAEGDTSYGFAG